MQLEESDLLQSAREIKIRICNLFFLAPLMKKVRTPMRTRSNSFSDSLFRTHFSGHGPWRHLLVCLVS
jgi:hypothetical protein